MHDITIAFILSGLNIIVIYSVYKCFKKERPSLKKYRTPKCSCIDDDLVHIRTNNLENIVTIV